MNFIRAKIENYKCIEDSNEFSLDQVTCLIGKNEAGKTALLEALYKLNPVESDKKDFTEEEFPRRHLSTYRERRDKDPANVLTTYWELIDDEVDAINDLIAPAKLEGSQVVIKKGYSNNLQWEISIDEQPLVDDFLEQANLNAPEKGQLAKSGSLKQLVKTIKSLETPTDKQKSLLDEILLKYPSGDITTKITENIKKQLPYFVYFSNYYQLPGRVSITDIKKRKQENRLEFGHKVFLSLLEMTNTSIDDIEGIQELEKLVMELEAVEASLTDEIKKFWSQNQHLEVRFRYDHSKPNDPPPLNEGFVFNTRIFNTRHRATVNFDVRSHGFIWFFSFLIWFSQVKRQYGDNLILLLDEPGLPLHGRAQQDLLRYINTRLRPNHQVIYSAHSPFLIDLENVFSLRTVEDVVNIIQKEEGVEEEILGTKVGQRILSRDVDTIFPLQGILGFDITQTLFVGPNVIVVEGPTEKALFDWFSRELISRGREGLDLRWAVCPAEGAAKISSFVTLFAGRSLNIAVFADYHTGQKALIDKLANAELIPEDHILLTKDFSGKDESDIEDVVGRLLYFELVNNALKLADQYKIPDSLASGPNDRTVKEVEKYCRTLPPGYKEFDHYLPIEFLFSLSRDEIEQLPNLEEALDRFEGIFKRVNSLTGNKDNVN